MEEKKYLPIGIENFEKLRRNGYYYVDKTGLLADFLHNPMEVTLFTRPRRFGKTLTLLMLKSFFEIGTDPALFEGLAISREEELCKQHRGKYPVLFLTLKDVEGIDFAEARSMLAFVIAEAGKQFQFLLNSHDLSAIDKEDFRQLLDKKMDTSTLKNALATLCGLLEKHYHKRAVLLIDEYDVPLQKAFYHRYYDQMVDLIRGMFSSCLKTNASLQFAVLTGCFRVSKESIFTGMNNLKVFTIEDNQFSEAFGFTDSEVREMMEYYGVADHYPEVRDWYDGYHFGRSSLYCPWDVINFCYDLVKRNCDYPQNYWAHTSGNDAVKEFVRRLNTENTRQELQTLVDGGTVTRKIRQELTYREMYSSPENLWSLLYTTGYLTKTGPRDGQNVPLAIPNKEILNIFGNQIMDLFEKEAKKDGELLRTLCQALERGDTKGVEDAFQKYLSRTVHLHDLSVPREQKENFYHGILLGQLGYKEGWQVSSNEESGDGFPDILISVREKRLGIVIEVKYAALKKEETAAREALKQIDAHRYYEKLLDNGCERLLKYGIACNRRECRVLLA